jgi:hypothetical protein
MILSSLQLEYAVVVIVPYTERSGDMALWAVILPTSSKLEPARHDSYLVY